MSSTGDRKWREISAEITSSSTHNAIDFFGRCEASAAGAFECYQGILFMFYNSTAALASMTLWMLIILRKFYPHWYRATRFLVFPNVFWRWFDKSNFPLRGTKEVVRIWFIISKATGLFWYNFVGMFVTLLFGVS